MYRRVPIAVLCGLVAISGCQFDGSAFRMDSDGRMPFLGLQFSQRETETPPAVIRAQEARMPSDFVPTARVEFVPAEDDTGSATVVWSDEDEWPEE